MLDVDVVIIGLNTEKTLKDCLQNIPGDVPVFYVDGGSKDKSIDVAKTFPHVKILSLNTPHPTPGAGRNRGWEACNSTWVQFLDSDTIVDSQWLVKAVAAGEQTGAAAVRGFCKERHPERLFSWIAELEWNDTPGECDFFGGNVLIRREVLQSMKGYNDQLVAGEDPELSYRMRKKGHRILYLPDVMVTHDIAMQSFTQYWRRAFRTGYGYAALRALHPEIRNREMVRLFIRAGGFFLFLLLCFWQPLFLLPALALLFYPTLAYAKFKKNMKLNSQQAFIYALHCSIVAIPQFFGVLRFYWGQLFKAPLRNQN